ncbi:hypothetical protein GGI07_003005 [Coemansia sp. Benny D115]|nr:hypothetical protein GGI07_003005 [Coemansia sp. Benny D115]
MLVAYLIRSTYALLATIALAFELVPWTREAFVKYGKTRSKVDNKPSNNNHNNGSVAGPAKSANSFIVALVSWFSGLTVPKHFFAQFYILGAISSLVLLLDLLHARWIHSQLASQQRQTDKALGYLFKYFMDWESRAEHLYYGLSGKSTATTFVEHPHGVAIASLSLYTLHVLLRLKESLYDQPKTNARMHIGQYGVGLIFYLVTPLATIIDSLYSPGLQTPSRLAVALGLLLYTYASVHQWRCHGILFRLRSRSLKENTGYVVPTGDLFSYVSCPHFLCEILLYVSLWMVTGFQATTLVWNIAWTAINLGITARESHMWYKQAFGDKYPRNHRALVPYIF